MARLDHLRQQHGPPDCTSRLLGRLPWQHLCLQPRLRPFTRVCVCVCGRFLHPISPSTRATLIHPTTTRCHAKHCPLPYHHHLCSAAPSRSPGTPGAHVIHARQTTRPRRKSCHGHLLTYRLSASLTMKPVINQENDVSRNRSIHRCVYQLRKELTLPHLVVLILIRFFRSLSPSTNIVSAEPEELGW